MNKTEKAAEIEILKSSFEKAQILIVTDYKGLTVEKFNKYRRKMEGANSSVKVVKNRLAKIALQRMGVDKINDAFKGTTAVAMSEVDPVSPAKVFSDFIKENEQVKFKAAYMGGQALTAAQIEALAKLPSREELIGSLLGSMLAPARNWVSVLAQIPRQVVNVLAAVRDQKEKSGS